MDILKTSKSACQGHSELAKTNRHRRPLAVFFGAHAAPAYVLSPFLGRRVGEPQRLKWNHKFSNPSLIIHARSYVPHSCPIKIALTVVRELLIALAAGGVG